MSNVQRPTLDAGDTKDRDAVESRRGAADPGPWTLDIGLKVSDLRKSFVSPAGEKIEVLRGVTFQARTGEAIAVTGASGAGKSTLLHLMAGLELSDHGSIEAGEFPLHQASASELSGFRNQRMGLVFQFHHLLKDLTALENVSLPLRINRQALATAQVTARAALQSVGLGDRSTHLIGNLSGGEQQRVAVCRALVNRPSIVLADEPTGNLDAVASEAIAGLLVSYAQNAQAIVIVATHNEDLAILCDRRLTLRDGRLYED